jgi:predicted nucleic acid-binding protein
VILADTSAWIEYLRGSGTRTHRALRAAIDADELLVTEPVLMEVLAGATTPRHAEELRSAMLALPIAGVSALDDYVHAAAIHRACRSKGETVRDIVVCLIAAVAIRNDAAVLHRDRDFDVIARHTELRIEA